VLLRGQEIARSIGRRRRPEPAFRRGKVHPAICQSSIMDRSYIYRS
jgi:hypothetical protein